MSNELNNIIARNSDGVYEGVAIGGDRYPGTRFIDHLLRYQDNPTVSVRDLMRVRRTIRMKTPQQLSCLEIGMGGRSQECHACAHSFSLLSEALRYFEMVLDGNYGKWFQI